jgi:hypothetical protein
MKSPVENNAVRAAKPQGSARDGAFRIPWMIAIAAVFVLNFLLPRSYLIFGVDHVSFLPLAFQIVWAGLALAAVACLPSVARKGVPRQTCRVLAALAVLSFFVFRTTLPGIHGDGETGGYPASGAARISLYPGADGRLQSFLNEGLSRILPDTVRFRYQFNALFQDFPLNASWILLTLLCGTALVLFATGMVCRWRASDACRAGLLAVILFSPPLLNAYGHFDSYIVPVLCIGFWFGALSYVSLHPRGVLGWAGLALALAAAAWAHPVLLVLGAYTALLPVLLLLGKTGFRIPLWGAAAAGILAGLAPYAIGRGNLDFFSPENRGLVPWLLHEKAMSCLSAALPALLLGGAVAWTRRRALRQVGPFQALAVFMALSSVLLFFSLWVGYGLRDEFLYSLLGAICLGAVVLLFLLTAPDERLVLAAAVFSLYLFAPKMWTYSGPRLYERFSAHMLRDRCNAARKFSAYYLIAAATPVDTPAYRERKLAVLAEGFTSPVAEWDQPRYRLMSRAHYTAWCLEFGKDQAAARQLEWLLLNAPEALPPLWRGNGRAFHNDLFLNRGPEKARALSRELLLKHRSDARGRELFDALELALDDAENNDPVVQYSPRPGTRESDLKDRMGEFRKLRPRLLPDPAAPAIP